MSGKIAHKKLWGKLVIDKQKSLGMICTPFTGQTSKGGIYYALLI